MKRYFILFALLFSLLSMPNSESIICASPCICGYDNDGDGQLNLKEYNDLVGDRPDFPSFEEVDINESGFIDSREISAVEGC